MIAQEGRQTLVQHIDRAHRWRAMRCIKQARKRSPARWLRDTRNWSPVEAVVLNPERDAMIGAHCQAEDKTRLLA